VAASFVPWNDELEPQSSVSSFTIDAGPGGSPCPAGARPFSPALQGGAPDNTAGAVTPLRMQVSRNDGEQELHDLRFDLPPGVLPSLRGVAYCPEAAIASLGTATGISELTTPACPITSQIGNLTSSQGAGSKPLHLPGKLYLAGPYRGAPVSVVAVVPAVSGPYDLGTVAVRSAAFVDPTTAEVSVATDTLPSIIDGIPLRLRALQLSVDREGFMRNPTNCARLAIGGAATGSEGATAPLDAHFQVANCTDLGFSPKLSIRLRGSTKRTGHPSLETTLTTSRGDANIGMVSVALPPTTILDNSNIGTSCSRRDFAAETCPRSSVYGQATARTPLLDEPLRGNVYLTAGPNKLPDLVIALRGQIAINLRGKVDTAKNSGIRTTFRTVPDAPVTDFRLRIPGGKDGLLVNSENVCSSRPKVVLRMRGQNGMRSNRRQRLGTSCGKARARARRIHHARGAGK
jgi:hypothetical protein